MKRDKSNLKYTESKLVKKSLSKRKNKLSYHKYSMFPSIRPLQFNIAMSTFLHYFL